MDLLSSSELLIDDLLEEYWFFDNLFTSRSRVLRYCHSDPYPSSSLGDSDTRKIQEAFTETNISIDRNRSSQTTLKRQFSEKIRVQEPRQDESFFLKKEHVVLPKSGSSSASRKIQEACLIRAPSLPPSIEKKDQAGFESKKMTNKLTRQFFEKIRTLEPTTKPSERFLQKKEISESCRRNKTRSSSGGLLQRTQTMPNNMRRRQHNVEDEFEDQESDSRMGFLIREALSSSHSVQKVSSNQRQRHLRSEETVMTKQSSSPKTLRKTVSSIETTKEIQRLKGCYDQLIDPRVKTGVATPPRVPKDSSRKEMKDQIKFWARAVASNVRQEC